MVWDRIMEWVKRTASRADWCLALMVKKSMDSNLSYFNVPNGSLSLTCVTVRVYFAALTLAL